MKIISSKENPEYLPIIIKYFQKIWASEESKMVYEDCIKYSTYNKGDIPNWYLLLDDETIVGCAGLIANDFISRMDLYPYLAALYIEESYRGKNLASLLINKIKEDCFAYGYHNLYLITDHIGYYEKFNFKYIGKAYHPWGESPRLYKCNVNSLKENILGTIESIVDESLPLISNLSNLSKLIKECFSNTSWAGFYIYDEDKNYLYLGPYQGSVACNKIAYGKGVCGTSLKEKKTIIVDDVEKYENHIACSSFTKSEIVTPIIKDNKVVAVIDLDSHLLANYSKEDQDLLEKIADKISKLF